MLSKKVSIVVPVYNEIKFVDSCIASLLSQTYQNLEIVILDNCSNDGTTELIKERHQNKLTHVVHSSNLGPQNNFDLSISYASGEYTCIYHADDVYSPDIIEKQVNYLDLNQDVAAVFCLAKYINEQGRVMGRQKLNFLKSDSKFGFYELLNLILINHNFLICPSLMIRTSVLKELQHWNWFFKSSADLEMWLRVASKYKIGILKSHLISCRISSKQWSETMRKRTARADFFVVMRFYINSYRQSISSCALNGYLYLRIKDYLTRINNCKNIVRRKRLARLFLGALVTYKAPVYKKVALFLLMLSITIHRAIKLD